MQAQENQKTTNQPSNEKFEEKRKCTEIGCLYKMAYSERK